MAMMMTGRVLLVCALCVLWCGAGGRCDEGMVESRAGGAGSGGEPSLASKQLENSPQDTQGLKGGVPGVKENVPPAPSAPTDEEDDEEDSEESEDEETEAEGESIEGQSGKRGTTVPDSDSREKNVSGSDQEKDQLIISARGNSPSNSQLSNAILTQAEFEKKDSGKNTPAVENPLTPVNGESILSAERNLPSPPEGVDSRKHDGEDTTSEGEKKNVPSPQTAATPKSHRGEGSEGTGEDTKATTVTANTNDTTNTQNSDGSTAAAAAVQPEGGMESNPAKNDLSPPSTEDAAQLSTAPDTEGASNSEENTNSQSTGNPNVTIATATQRNDTTKPGDSDGSTAISHTTSPLLLLLLLVAYAAAVVAA
ncbi:mucin-associated surface protein [Trypanosoma cruzi cruzi]|uniref:Mucin-associated surface protein (MASP) n=1 Tax=Trypanosoma cruzi TaxID=5693 RepID=A0A2V2W529_TRYCR|nr:mucin-associated surface protein [Trypanosoma cruzi cruzi]PWV02619.1 Mucin-associated surface protein (MASP) [Trypanosoma cruzi]